jgi:hypothetical protein
MSLSIPLPFTEALDFFQTKTPLLTTGNTAQLQKLSSDIKRRALFSATVANAELLSEIGAIVNDILAGHLDQATGRARVKLLLDRQGYAPEAGKEGGLQDLSGDRRLNLILETNAQTAQGFGWFTQGNDPDVLHAWPAQELYRALEPKGKERDWPDRWDQCGGTFYGERMIALKSDPIWDKLGDPDRFADGLGNPWPPFAFNSGMDVRDVPRREAIALNLIDADTSIFPKQVGLNDALEATVETRDKVLRGLMEAQGIGRFVGDVFQFFAGGAN